MNAQSEYAVLFGTRLLGVAHVTGGRFVRVNEEFARIVGSTPDALAGAPDGALAPTVADGRVTYEREHATAEGGRRTLLIDAAPLDGGWLLTVVDVTERQQRAVELENARALLSSAVDSMSDGFVLFGPDDRIVLCNQVYAEMLEGAGVARAFGPAHEMVGMHVEEIIRRQIAQGQPIPPEYADNVEGWVAERLALHRNADGQPHVQQLSGGRWVQSIRHRTPDGGIVVLRSDITAFKESEAAARLQAQQDPLTGLPNRRLLQDRLTQALARAERAGTVVAVLLLDLDEFKPVNDTHGHRAGDEVLRVIAGRLQDCLRSADTVARFGGDEFVVLVDGLARREDADAVATKIIEAIARPIPVTWAASAADAAVHISCSIGISAYPADGTLPETLVRHADAAMYLAKQAGRGRFVHHSAG